MRLAHDETLHLRLPAAMRAALDGEARAAGVKLSVATRTALAVGLKAIESGAAPRHVSDRRGAPNAVGAA